MPSLINDLSLPQRNWLFETLGNDGEIDELQQVAEYQPGSRRFSDFHSVPYQNRPPRDLVDIPDNRNSIFRYGGRPPTGLDEKPITWSPTERIDFNHFDSRGFHVLPPFPRSNSRAGLQDNLDLKRQGEATGNKSPIYPHLDEKLTWQQSFENLQVYQRTYGDCNVPQKYKLNIKLGGWVVSLKFSRT
jgi:hypothetical protein